MGEDNDILKLLREKEAEAFRTAQKAMVLQPGAIGDCILTLPLVEFMKQSIGVGAVDIFGHTEYTGILPGRSCVDSVRSIDSIELHRLFLKKTEFNLADYDPLINTFADYTWVVTFMGGPGSDFERNLVFTINCSHSAEVITLTIKPPEDFSGHLIDFYLQQFSGQLDISSQVQQLTIKKPFITLSPADKRYGAKLLEENRVELSKDMAIIAPGSGGREKCWKLENFTELAKELSAGGWEVVFLTGPAEQERFGQEQMDSLESTAKCLSDLTLNDVVGVLANAGLFIGNDSGITHLAAASGVKTIAIFGQSNPVIYSPLGPDVAVFAVKSGDFAVKPNPKLQRQILDAL